MHLPNGIHWGYIEIRSVEHLNKNDNQIVKNWIGRTSPWRDVLVAVFPQLNPAKEIEGSRGYLIFLNIHLFDGYNS